jgi:hypothetical protein
MGKNPKGAEKKAPIKPLSEGNQPKTNMNTSGAVKRVTHPAITALNVTPFGVSSKAMSMLKGKKGL